LTRRFRNWIPFQVRGETPTLLGPLERTNQSTGPLIEVNSF
jgi:hypothetical protein